MKLKQAIKILEEQKQKVLNPEYKNDRQLVIETGSYIKDFFGLNSAEFNFINSFKFHIDFGRNVSDETKPMLLKSKEDSFIKFLDNCKRTLKNKGIVKSENKNWFSNKGNDFFIKTAIGLIIFGFGIGYWTKEFEVFSVSKTKTLKSLPSNITEKPTDSIYKIRNDK